MGKPEVRAWVNPKLRTDTLVRGNVVGVVLLVEGWVVWQRVLALALVQDLLRGVVHVKLIKGSDLLSVKLELGNSISRETPHPVVAHQRAKFSCWGQKLMSGLANHFLAYFAVVNLIWVLVKICLNLVVK